MNDSDTAQLVLPQLVDTKLSHYICNKTRGKSHGKQY
jgi:hypothetical protein